MCRFSISKTALRLNLIVTSHPGKAPASNFPQLVEDTVSFRPPEKIPSEMSCGRRKVKLIAMRKRVRESGKLR